MRVNSKIKKSKIENNKMKPTFEIKSLKPEQVSGVMDMLRYNSDFNSENYRISVYIYAGDE